MKLYWYFVSQSSEFCRHNPLCYFSTSVYCYCCCYFVIDSVRKLLDTPSYAVLMNKLCYMQETPCLIFLKYKVFHFTYLQFFFVTNYSEYDDYMLLTYLLFVQLPVTADSITDKLYIKRMHCAASNWPVNPLAVVLRTNIVPLFTFSRQILRFPYRETMWNSWNCVTDCYVGEYIFNVQLTIN
jgi:hypothetical protein